MNKHEVIQLKKDLDDILENFKKLDSRFEYLRSFYKHQNEELDSISESIIVSFKNQYFDSLPDELDELIDILEEENA